MQNQSNDLTFKTLKQFIEIRRRGAAYISVVPALIEVFIFVEALLFPLSVKGRCMESATLVERRIAVVHASRRRHSSA